MKKYAVAVLVSLELTAVPIVAQAAVYGNSIPFTSVTTYDQTHFLRFTTTSTTLHFYGVQYLDGGDSQYPSGADMIYGCKSTDGLYSYSHEQIGDFKSSDWGYYWYNVPNGKTFQTSIITNGYYSDSDSTTPGPATTGSYYVANS